MEAKPITIDVPGFGEVSGLWQEPVSPSACLVLGHGAGAGMTHRSMEAIADGLKKRGVATLRYQFPYMEKGSKRPDAPALAQATVRAAAAEGVRRASRMPVFAGGRSFGGRMTSQAQSLSSMPGVCGLVFFAFPLHPAGKPAVTRADHLVDVAVPMLFLSGSRDKLAELDLLRRTVKKLGARATLDLFADADHAFHVPARFRRSDDEVLGDALDVATQWMVEQSDLAKV